MYTQYTLHWSESFWRDVLIELPLSTAMNTAFDPILYLNDLYTHNYTLIQYKQELIRSRVFELQYSLEGPYTRAFLHPSKLSSVIYQETTDTNTTSSILQHAHDTSTGTDAVHAINWPKDIKGMYIRDAYDISITHVLSWHSGRVKPYRGGTVEFCWEGVLDRAGNKGRGECVRTLNSTTV